MSQPLRTFAFFFRIYSSSRKGAPDIEDTAVQGNRSQATKSHFNPGDPAKQKGAEQVDQTSQYLKGSNITLAIVRIITSRNLFCLPYHKSGELSTITP